ncbi:MAG: riboflavin biosynthesis protein RibF [Lachnospiraceae bacterium]|nr:riboflavin biosynthesis protein RibF [Lachnospiraceae bacterium]
MQIISGTTEFHIDEPTALSIGKFDGVHLGHRKILSLVAEQKSRGLVPSVFTFDPSPDELFTGVSAGSLLTKEEKEETLSMLGVEILVEYPMNRETAAILPEEFLRNVLRDRLNTRYVAAGDDLSFGRGGEGDAAFLKAEAPVMGMEAEIVEKVVKRGEVVSSTLIRSYLRKGDMERVAELMAAPYYVDGIVEDGDHRGRSLGFPTINVRPSPLKLLPPRGVYRSVVFMEDRIYAGITNIGVKPTFGDHNPCITETYLYDFDGDAYGKRVRVELLAFMRGERRFSSPEELKEQVDRDLLEGAPTTV